MKLLKKCEECQRQFETRRPEAVYCTDRGRMKVYWRTHDRTSKDVTNACVAHLEKKGAL